MGTVGKLVLLKDEAVLRNPPFKKEGPEGVNNRARTAQIVLIIRINLRRIRLPRGIYMP